MLFMNQTSEDLIFILLIWIVLTVLYQALQFVNYQYDWYPVEKLFDVTNEMGATIISIQRIGIDWSIFLSILTTPFAMFFAATNDRLAVPIRLMATVENALKLVFAIKYLLTSLCQSDYNIGGPLTCSESVMATFWSIDFYVTRYSLTDIAQYCQLWISLSRFMALAFDGLYFHHTLRLPVVQLLFPFALCISITHLDLWWQETFYYTPYRDLTCAFLFLMCALDFTINRRVKRLKNTGKASSRAEVLLMYQMISNSLMILAYSIIYMAISIPANFFFGFNLFWILTTFSYILFNFLFYFLASIICILFLRKRKERRHIGASTTTLSKTVTTNITSRVP